MNYTFEIVSPKYGTLAVTAPARFCHEVEKHTWHVYRDPTRAEGRQLVVAAHVPHPAGGLRKRGSGVRQTTLYLHQLVWKLAGKPSTKHLDHRDGQPLNNSEDNLRAATREQNAHNRRRLRNNTSGVIGVSWHPQLKRWWATIGVNGKRKSLGTFDRIEDAREARDTAARELHREFAVLNAS